MALTGGVVNDSLVMVDFVNRNRPQYPSLLEAVRASGVQRFRAIMLTSLTTFAGLAPLVFFEKSASPVPCTDGISSSFWCDVRNSGDFSVSARGIHDPGGH